MYVEIYPTIAIISEPPRMKYGKGTNKSTLKVRCCHGEGMLCTNVLVPYYATVL